MEKGFSARTIVVFFWSKTPASLQQGPITPNRGVMCAERGEFPPFPSPIGLSTVPQAAKTKGRWPFYSYHPGNPQRTTRCPGNRPYTQSLGRGQQRLCPMTPRAHHFADPAPLAHTAPFQSIP